MKHTTTTTAAPTKRPAKPTPYNLTFAALAGLPTGPAAKTAPKRAAPPVAAKTARPAPAPVPAVKAAPRAYDFSHLPATVAGPIYTPPTAPAAVAPKESGAAIEARLHANMQTALPLRQQRR